MKPRLRKVEGFWHCVAPDAQGIGDTPYLAYREYKDLLLDVIRARIEEGRAESARKELEYQAEVAALNLRALMAAYGFEIDCAGNVVRDFWVEAQQWPTGATYVPAANTIQELIPMPTAR